MDSPSFLILHGIENLQPPEHWHHWLTLRLRERGCEVRYPALPEPFEPKLKAFVQEARWCCSGRWRMGNEIRSLAAGVQFSVFGVQ